MPLKRLSSCSCGRERAFSALAHSSALAPSISSIQTYGSSSFAASSVDAQRMPTRTRSFMAPSLSLVTSLLTCRRRTGAGARHSEVRRHRLPFYFLIRDIDVEERATLRCIAVLETREALFLHEHRELLVLLELGQRLFRRLASLQRPLSDRQQLAIEFRVGAE